MLWSGKPKLGIALNVQLRKKLRKKPRNCIGILFLLMRKKLSKRLRVSLTVRKQWWHLFPRVTL
ncbi:hypothetical protein D3C84_1216700 [compost metagenome]